MVEREFIVYDGEKFCKRIGAEINGSGHYKIQPSLTEPISVLGVFLDNEENFKNFKKDFYDVATAYYSSYLEWGEISYNYILVGKNYLKSFMFMTSSYTNTDQSENSLFEELLATIKTIGYVNDPYSIRSWRDVKYLKIPITNKITKKKTDMYFIPLDALGTNFSTVTLQKEDLQ